MKAGPRAMRWMTPQGNVAATPMDAYNRFLLPLDDVVFSHETDVPEVSLMVRGTIECFERSGGGAWWAAIIPRANFTKMGFTSSWVKLPRGVMRMPKNPLIEYEVMYYLTISNQEIMQKFQPTVLGFRLTE